VEPQTRGLPPPDPRFLCPLFSTEFVEPARKKNPGCATGRLMKPNVFVFTHEVYIFIIFLPVNETRRSSIHVLWVLLDNEVFVTENAPIQSGLFYKVMQFLLMRHNPNRA
jgi:hypothetical protein